VRLGPSCGGACRGAARFPERRPARNDAADRHQRAKLPDLHNSTGERVVISGKRIWAFKHNPYVVLLDELEAEQYPVLDLLPDCRLPEQARNYAELTNSITASSQAEYMCLNLGFTDVTLRHPRLYCHEDSRIVPDKVVVHTTGADRTRGSVVMRRTKKRKICLPLGITTKSDFVFTQPRPNSDISGEIPSSHYLRKLHCNVAEIIAEGSDPPCLVRLIQIKVPICHRAINS
jgi:hypothetical protein